MLDALRLSLHGIIRKNEKLMCCLVYAFTKRVNVVRVTHLSTHTIMARYATKSNSLHKLYHCLKLILYEKYGTQRVVLRQNTALSFTSCFRPLFYVPYFSYNTCVNALTPIFNMCTHVCACMKTTVWLHKIKHMHTEYMYVFSEQSKIC